MNIVNIKDINNSTLFPDGLIINEDNRFENVIKTAANKIIAEKNEKPIILLSGPSGSGKTTVAFKLEKYLDNSNSQTHVISMDRYFAPTDENIDGVDLEHPGRVDSELLVQDLSKILNGECIKVPDFNFKDGSRYYPGDTLQKKDGELILIEGIHALNPDIMDGLLKKANGIYVSPRTRIKLSDSTLVHPQKIRLLRRILRDCQFRGQSYEDVIKRAISVDRGEDLYITPYKGNASINIDTFLNYEVPIIKPLIDWKFRQLDKSFIDEFELEDVIKLLDECSPIDSYDAVNQYAIIREFIGNSGFKY